MWITGQSQGVKLVVLLAFLLMITAQLVNYFVKSSLHISLNIFLAFLLFPISTIAGVLFAFFIFLIGWSRLVLNRHTVVEVLTGVLIGVTFGVASLFI
jgi:hypothetical protein